MNPTRRTAQAPWGRASFGWSEAPAAPLPSTSQTQRVGAASLLSRWGRQALVWELSLHRWLDNLWAGHRHLDAVKRQSRVLTRMVRCNRHTTFGVQHGFGTIHGYDDYVRQVPVMDDTQLLHWLHYRAEHDPRALSAAPRSWREAAATPLMCKERTTRRTRTAVTELLRRCPAGFEGSLLISDRDEARACADVSRRLQGKLVLPDAVWDLSDANLRELLILRLAIARADITSLSGPDEATLRHWIHTLEAHHRFLLKDLRQGGFFMGHRLPPALLAALEPALRAQPDRAQALAHERARTGRLRPADLWPRLALLITPGGHDLENFIGRELPAGVHVIERTFENDPLRRALSAPAEGRVCLPELDAHFYEFAERAQWDAGTRTAVTSQRLRQGLDYYLIISGEYGLYRYFTGDVVTLAGWQDGLPLLRFLSPAPATRAVTAMRPTAGTTAAGARSSVELTKLAA